MWTRLSLLLSRRVDGGSLAIFRICFGLVMALEALTLLVPRGGMSPLERFYTGPRVYWNFPYHGFEWVRALPEPWMSLVCWFLVLASGCLAIGIAVRAAAAGVFLAWTYIFLIEETYYNNHYYLQSLLAFLLVGMKSDARFGMRSWRARRRANIDEQEGLVPFWNIFLLRLQLFVVYFFGGITKLSEEWLFHAEPMRSWLAEPRVVEAATGLIPNAWGMDASVAQLMSSAGFAFFMSYAGLVYDLAIGFLLVFRRTRLLGMALTVVFHAVNHLVLFDDIAWFPLMATTTTTIFLEPDWPRRVKEWLRHPRMVAPDWIWFWAGFVFLPVVGGLLGWKFAPSSRPRPGNDRAGTRILIFVLVWGTVQFLLPLRHFLLPGPVNWTAEFERFSWRMKSGQKQSRPIRVKVVDPAILSHGLDGETVIHWDQWHGPRAIYAQWNGQGTRWDELPEFVIQFQEIYGERILFNPHAVPRDQPLSFKEAENRVLTYWQQTYGRFPKIHRLLPLDSCFQILTRKIGDSSEERAFVEAMQKLQAQFRGLCRGGMSDGAFNREMQALREQFVTLSSNPKHGHWIRLAFGQSVPFPLENGDRPSTCLLIEDDKLLTSTDRHGGKYVGLVYNEWKEEGDFAPTVYGDYDRMTIAEWSAFEPVFLATEEGTRVFIQWNQQADLCDWQNLSMPGRPFMCHQYARRIAGLWERKTGRYPQVYFQTQVRLLPYDFQSLVDPDVDLATVSLNLWGHNPWITPLRRVHPKDSAFDRGSNSHPPKVSQGSDALR